MTRRARSLLQSPPDVPADCPGTNSAADIAASAGVGACLSGDPKAVAGVESGLQDRSGRFRLIPTSAGMGLGFTATITATLVKE
jgi:hypothetical protein